MQSYTLANWDGSLLKGEEADGEASSSGNGHGSAIAGGSGQQVVIGGGPVALPDARIASTSNMGVGGTDVEEKASHGSGGSLHPGAKLHEVEAKTVFDGSAVLSALEGGEGDFNFWDSSWPSAPSRGVDRDSVSGSTSVRVHIGSEGVVQGRAGVVAQKLSGVAAASVLTMKPAVPPHPQLGATSFQPAQVKVSRHAKEQGPRRTQTNAVNSHGSSGDSTVPGVEEITEGLGASRASLWLDSSTSTSRHRSVVQPQPQTSGAVPAALAVVPTMRHGASSTSAIATQATPSKALFDDLFGDEVDVTHASPVDKPRSANAVRQQEVSQMNKIASSSKSISTLTPGTAKATSSSKPTATNGTPVIPVTLPFPPPRIRTGLSTSSTESIPPHSAKPKPKSPQASTNVEKAAPRANSEGSKRSSVQPTWDLISVYSMDAEGEPESAYTSRSASVMFGMEGRESEVMGGDESRQDEEMPPNLQPELKPHSAARVQSEPQLPPHSQPQLRLQLQTQTQSPRDGPVTDEPLCSPGGSLFSGPSSPVSVSGQSVPPFSRTEAVDELTTYSSPPLSPGRDLFSPEVEVADNGMREKEKPQVTPGSQVQQKQKSQASQPRLTKARPTHIAAASQPGPSQQMFQPRVAQTMTSARPQTKHLQTLPQPRPRMAQEQRKAQLGEQMKVDMGLQRARELNAPKEPTQMKGDGKGPKDVRQRMEGARDKRGEGSKDLQRKKEKEKEKQQNQNQRQRQADCLAQDVTSKGSGQGAGRSQGSHSQMPANVRTMVRSFDPRGFSEKQPQQGRPDVHHRPATKPTATEPQARSKYVAPVPRKLISASAQVARGFVARPGISLPKRRDVNDSNGFAQSLSRAINSQHRPNSASVSFSSGSATLPSSSNFTPDPHRRTEATLLPPRKKRKIMEYVAVPRLENSVREGYVRASKVKCLAGLYRGGVVNGRVAGGATDRVAKRKVEGGYRREEGDDDEDEVVFVSRSVKVVEENQRSRVVQSAVGGPGTAVRVATGPVVVAGPSMAKNSTDRGGTRHTTLQDAFASAFQSNHGAGSDEDEELAVEIDGERRRRERKEKARREHEREQERERSERKERHDRMRMVEEERAKELKQQRQPSNALQPVASPRRVQLQVPPPSPHIPTITKSFKVGPPINGKRRVPRTDKVVQEQLQQPRPMQDLSQIQHNQPDTQSKAILKVPQVEASAPLKLSVSNIAMPAPAVVSIPVVHALEPSSSSFSEPAAPPPPSTSDEAVSDPIVAAVSVSEPGAPRLGQPPGPICWTQDEDTEAVTLIIHRLETPVSRWDAMFNTMFLREKPLKLATVMKEVWTEFEERVQDEEEDEEEEEKEEEEDFAPLGRKLNWDPIYLPDEESGYYMESPTPEPETPLDVAIPHEDGILFAKPTVPIPAINLKRSYSAISSSTSPSDVARATFVDLQEQLSIHKSVKKQRRQYERSRRGFQGSDSGSVVSVSQSYSASAEFDSVGEHGGSVFSGYAALPSPTRVPGPSLKALGKRKAVDVGEMDVNTQRTQHMSAESTPHAGLRITSATLNAFGQSNPAYGSSGQMALDVSASLPVHYQQRVAPYRNPLAGEVLFASTVSPGSYLEEQDGPFHSMTSLHNPTYNHANLADSISNNDLRTNTVATETSSWDMMDMDGMMSTTSFDPWAINDQDLQPYPFNTINPNVLGPDMVDNLPDFVEPEEEIGVTGDVTLYNRLQLKKGLGLFEENGAGNSANRSSTTSSSDSESDSSSSSSKPSTSSSNLPLPEWKLKRKAKSVSISRIEEEQQPKAPHSPGSLIFGPLVDSAALDHDSDGSWVGSDGSGSAKRKVKRVIRRPMRQIDNGFFDDSGTESGPLIKKSLLTPAIKPKWSGQTTGKIGPPQRRTKKGEPHVYCHPCRRKVQPTMECLECALVFCARCIDVRFPEITFGEFFSKESPCPRCTDTCRCDKCCHKRGETYVPMARRKSRVHVTLRADATSSPQRQPRKTNQANIPVPAEESHSTPIVMLPTGATYWAPVYGLDGTLVAGGFINRDGSEPSIIYAQTAETARFQKRMFIGAVQDCWRLASGVKIVDLAPVTVPQPPKHGKGKQNEKRKWYIGKKAPLYLRFVPKRTQDDSDEEADESADEEKREGDIDAMAGDGGAGCPVEDSAAGNVGDDGIFKALFASSPLSSLTDSDSDGGVDGKPRALSTTSSRSAASSSSTSSYSDVDVWNVIRQAMGACVPSAGPSEKPGEEPTT
ncbi:hypothetical protein FA15DRAFT_669434 [Coprinopsis marcescibilis]|uniref:Zinc-finger domain-containing protein n=1 Tax=Coprinopsis marcescibilis TaxID=230819 RepID=A0A5C3KV80_COPMA|nr:hypothetical protein FA15DRAFT_669434 [Coprinopsis marcescibilis]